VQIGEGVNTREAVLNASNPSVEVELGEKAFFQTSWDFVKLGIEHIFTGYDHLAFLAGLLIMTTTLRSLLKSHHCFHRRSQHHLSSRDIRTRRHTGPFDREFDRTQHHVHCHREFDGKDTRSSVEDHVLIRSGPRVRFFKRT
jgi:hypothetical protein